MLLLVLLLLLLLLLLPQIFWSATFMAVPDLLLNMEQFSGWMMCLHQAMRKPLPWVRHQHAHHSTSTRDHLHAYQLTDCILYAAWLSRGLHQAMCKPLA
jgi:hypothetical protein